MMFLTPYAPDSNSCDSEENSLCRPIYRISFRSLPLMFIHVLAVSVNIMLVLLKQSQYVSYLSETSLYKSRSDVETTAQYSCSKPRLTDLNLRCSSYVCSRCSPLRQRRPKNMLPQPRDKNKTKIKIFKSPLTAGGLGPKMRNGTMDEI